MELRAEVVLGVMANKFVKEIKSQTSIQKYNANTGEPYFINKNEIKYELNGREYSADELDDFLADMNLEKFPVQHGNEWILEDMVFGVEVTSDPGGQVCSVTVMPDSLRWLEIQKKFSDLGCEIPISLHCVLNG